MYMRITRHEVILGFVTSRMAIKVTFQILMFALAFAIFTTHQAWGEQDCHDEKEDVEKYCIGSIKINGDYEPTTAMCRQVVGRSDMACICCLLNPRDEVHVSAVKLVRLARDCRKPLPSGSRCGSKYDILTIRLNKLLITLSFFVKRNTCSNYSCIYSLIM